MAVMIKKETDLWSIPQKIFDELNREFKFTFVLRPTGKNVNHSNGCLVSDDGLKQDWGGETVFCNPPYDKDIKGWIKKCYEESKKPGTLVVMFIPLFTDTSCLRDVIYKKARQIRFIKDQIKFRNGNSDTSYQSAVVVF